MDLNMAFYTCAIIMFLGGCACGSVAFGARRYPAPPDEAAWRYVETVDWYPGCETIFTLLDKRLATMGDLALRGKAMIAAAELEGI